MSIGPIGSTTAATTAPVDTEKAQLAREVKLAADTRAQAADRILKADEAARTKDQETVRSSSKLGNAVDVYL
jgi:hypothetical protein